MTLLKSGELSVGELAKKLNSQRSTIYYLIESLKEKGFVFETLKGKIKLFKASNPKILENQAQETYEKIKGHILRKNTVQQPKPPHTVIPQRIANGIIHVITDGCRGKYVPTKEIDKWIENYEQQG